jgi:hypothetical protein
MKKLRDYQKKGAQDGVEILRSLDIVYFSWSVRTGKSATALETCRLFGASRVLFLTKKKAISSIQSDYDDFGYAEYFSIVIVNDESMHKIDGDFDIVVHDEHHRFGSFPKPGLATKLFKHKFSNKPMIFLSGTMSPESFSQLYHQFWVSDRSPWSRYKNFYGWAKDYVNIRQKRIGALMHNDYSSGIETKIMADLKPYILTYTQEQAGFKSEIREHFLYVEMSPLVYSLEERLLKDLLVEGKEEVIMADTPAKLQSKLMQLEGGTMKFESGNSKVLDTTKAEFIKSHFAGKKLGIFYVFKEELNALKSVFGNDLTTDLDTFNSTDKAIALQVVSGREGISLKNADCLVMYNIQHSAVSYFQSRDRLTTLDRPNNDVYWIFSKRMIGEKIYKVVQKKKKYTVNHFKRDYGKASAI